MSSFEEDLEAELAKEEGGVLSVSVAKHEATKREKTKLKLQLGRMEAERKRQEDLIDQLSLINDSGLDSPTWLQPKKKKGQSTATACLMVSDSHFDEVVNPDEIEGLNAYNREIAQQRLQRTFEKCIRLTDDYLSGFKYDGVTLFLGGDMVTGTLHDLAESNEAHLPDTVLFWSEQLSAGIEMLRKRYGKVHVTGVVGNHGRNTFKPRTKGRVRDNNDWLIYKLIERDFKDKDEVTFAIPESADILVDVYDTTFRVTHGDQFTGGGGIAGIATAIVRGDSRKRKLSMETGQRYDWLVMGHFHQLTWYKSIIVNGANKGYDEYAYLKGFEYEEPCQAFWVTTPENGVIFNAPILTMDKKAEKW